MEEERREERGEREETFYDLVSARRGNSLLDVPIPSLLLSFSFPPLANPGQTISTSHSLSPYFLYRPFSLAPLPLHLSLSLTLWHSTCLRAFRNRRRNGKNVCTHTERERERERDLILGPSFSRIKRVRFHS
jgi:hypothetical protein